MPTKNTFANISKKILLDKNINDYLLLIFPYLKMSESHWGTIGTSIEEIVKSIGYTPDNHTGRINDKILKCLKWLSDNGYISISLPLTRKISSKTFIKIIINNNDFFQTKNKNGNLSSFVILESEEYLKITNKDNKVNKGVLLRVFLNIKKRMDFSSDSLQYCFPSNKCIMKDCFKTSSQIITNAIKELERIGLIYIHRESKCNTDELGKISKYTNIYALDSGTIEKIKSNHTINKQIETYLKVKER